MTTRNLDALFGPKAIALVGASNRPGSVGDVLARNLLSGGFSGAVMPVNRRGGTVRSTLAYKTVSELPVAPDLAVIATPAATVPQLISELGAQGCRAAIVISSGFEAAQEDGTTLRQSMLDASRPHLLRIIGPNCLGFISPGLGLNASFAHLSPRPGSIALVSQSGAVAAAAIDWAAGRGIGFSHVVSIGDAADVDVGDLLDYLATDPKTRAILLYVESVTDARKFMSAGRIASRSKPVIVVKAGRSASGARAAFSHTGALAGSDAVYDAAFRRAGMLRVNDLRELFDAVETLSTGLAAHGDRLAIVTNGGGAGILAVDALEARGGRLASLSTNTKQVLQEKLPRSRCANPLDLLGDAPPDAYATAMRAVLGDPGVDAILVMNCPTAVTDSTRAAEAVISVVGEAQAKKPVFTCWLGDPAVRPGREAFARALLPTHETPDESVRAFLHLVRHRENQERLLIAPEAPPPAASTDEARKILAQVRANGRDTLTDPEARALLKIYGVPVVESREAPDPDAAAKSAAELGGRLVLKILSKGISHKSDVGGVALGLEGPEQVRAAARDMLAHIATRLPEARLDGFVLEPMIERPLAHETIVGLASDAAFGPVVLFGQGGVSTEVVGDRSLGLPPLDAALADDMIARTRIARLLAGFRNRPPVDHAALQGVLLAVSRIAADLPDVQELDINPLLVDAQGVLALDARVRLHPLGRAPVRMAILPYPSHLERSVTVGGQDLLLRPVRPQDAAKLAELVDRSSRDDVHARFAGGLSHLSPEFAARLAQVDYDRHLALVAEDAAGDLLGVARMVGDPAGDSAELAIMVRSDVQHRGIGGVLLEALVREARERGLHSLWGDVAVTNEKMLALGAEHGFRAIGRGDPLRARIVRRLDGPEAPIS